MTKLIVGLGNPGKEYEKTRHNVGFMIIDDFAKSLSKNFDRQKFYGLYTEYIHNDDKIILLKPQKYMNLSGEVVRDFMHYFDIKVEDILIISDDVNLPVGKIRLRRKGSSGGHNGLKNIELHLSTNEYKRLRIGVSNDTKIDMKNFVLSKFSENDINLIKDKYEDTRYIINHIFDEQIELLMSKYN